MAHANINARRAAVSALLKNDAIDTAARKALAAEFSCSVTAILADIITLTHDVKREHIPSKRRGSRHVSSHMRARIRKRDKDTCQYCGIQQHDNWIIEHIVPASRGGLAETKNLVLACAPCNVRKRSEIWVPMNIVEIAEGDSAWVRWVVENASPTLLVHPE